MTISAGDTIILATNVVPSSVTYSNGGTVSLITNMANGNDAASYGVVYIYKVTGVLGSGNVTVNVSSPADIKIVAAVYRNVGDITGVSTYQVTSSTLTLAATNVTDGYVQGIWACSGGTISSVSGATTRVTGPPLIATTPTSGARTMTATFSSSLPASGAIMVLNPQVIPTNQFFAML